VIRRWSSENANKIERVAIIKDLRRGELAENEIIPRISHQREREKREGRERSILRDALQKVHFLFPLLRRASHANQFDQI